MNYQQDYRLPKQQQPNAPRPRKKASRKTLVGVLAGIVAAVVIFAGVYLGVNEFNRRQDYSVLAAEMEAVQNVYLPNIYVDGIQLGGMTAQEGIDAVINQIDSRQSGWSLDLTYQGHVFYTLTYDTLGVRTDISQVYSLLQELYQMGKTGTLEERKQVKDTLAETPYHAYTTQSDMNDVHLDSILSQIKGQLTTEPVDAYVAYFYPDLADPFIIQGESYGSTLDTDKLKQDILAMATEGKGGALEIVPDRIAPAITAQDVRKQVTLLCRATTPISSASTYDRT
ncbi:MAG: peptidoglycan binding domain-containing protein, partial [Clostridia bacterium]|nr:peptidoglycan binding domain-containing protein [Clostridia bacterium]